MPTFQSIHLHKDLHQRLLKPPNQDGVSITTPQAILSRNPYALAKQIIQKSPDDGNNNYSNADVMARVETVRCQVAHAMMASTKTGMFRHQQQQFYDDETSHNNQYHANRPLILGATVSAMQALHQERQQLGQVSSISTGCRALDDILSLPPEFYNNVNMPGFPRGHVLCFSGPSGSGKTQLSLQLAVQALTIPPPDGNTSRVRYCYSSAGHAGGALVRRFSQLVNNKEQSFQKRALKNIEFQPIRTMTSLVMVLSALEEELLQTHRHAASVYQPPFMLIVDCLSGLEVVQEEHSQVARIGRWLKRLARQYSLWVIIVGHNNHVPSSPGHDFHIVCAPTYDHDSILATLVHHPSRHDQSSISLFHTPFGMTTKSTLDT